MVVSVERQDWLVMNLVVVQVAMYLERMVGGVAAEALQAAIRDSQVSGYPVPIVAEQV